MSEPNWELLGGGGTVGGPIDYIGAWSASITYKPGEIVRYNGVDYLCVNTALGQTPPALPIIADTGWTTMVLEAGSHYGAPYGPPRYRKLSNGMVVCDGLIVPGAAGARHFTFPVGYRPNYTAAADLIFVTAMSTSTYPGEIWRLNTNGELRTSSGVALGAAWVTISGIQFYAG